MTKDRCPEVEELGATLRLAEQDPRRRHLDECPRCRARLASYLEFLKPGPEPAGARAAEADLRLAAVLEQAMAGEAKPARGAAPAGRPVARPSLVRSLFAPAAKPAWAAAAALIVVGVLYAAFVHERPGSRRPVLRGAPVPTAAAGAPVLLPTRPAPEGLELRWTSTPGAESYQLRLYAPDLSEIARLGPFADTAAVLRAADRPAGVSPGTTLIWRVVALRQGDEVATSTIGRLQAP